VWKNDEELGNTTFTVFPLQRPVGEGELRNIGQMKQGLSRLRLKKARGPDGIPLVTEGIF
jgi:hypothetical protein